MKLYDTLNKSYGNFTMDISDIDCRRSVSKNNVELSYHGPMPERFKGAQNATIYLNVQPTQCKIILRANKENGEKIKATVKATDKEITAIMNGFFFKPDGNTRFDTGLSDYWLGVWQAHYLDWKRTK